MYDNVSMSTLLSCIASEDILRGVTNESPWPLQIPCTLMSTLTRSTRSHTQFQTVLITFYCNPTVWWWYVHAVILCMHPSLNDHLPDVAAQNSFFSIPWLPCSLLSMRERKPLLTTSMYHLQRTPTPHTCWLANTDDFHIASIAHLHPSRAWLVDDAQPPIYKSANPPPPKKKQGHYCDQYISLYFLIFSQFVMQSINEDHRLDVVSGDLTLAPVPELYVSNEK